MLFQIKNSCPQVFDLGGWFLVQELKLVEIKKSGIMVTTKAYLEKILKR